MSDVLSVGEPLWEMSAIPSEPNKYTFGFGGDTLNFCVAAARQGASVKYISRVGSDPFGERINTLCATEKIDTSLIEIDTRLSTGGYFVHHENGRHSFSYARAGSAATKLSPKNIDAGVISVAKLAHSSGITQAISRSARDAVLSLFRAARASSVLTVYDPNLRLRLWSLSEAREAVHEILPHTDYFFPSFEDAVELSGTAEHDSIFRWAHSAGAKVVLLKLGANGVLVSEGHGTIPIHAPPFSVGAIDATGAGDCFAGSFAARLVAGDRLRDAVTYACAAAAITTTSYGATSAIPFRDAVVKLIGSRATS